MLYVKYIRFALSIVTYTLCRGVHTDMVATLRPITRTHIDVTYRNGK